MHVAELAARQPHDISTRVAHIHVACIPVWQPAQSFHKHNNSTSVPVPDKDVGHYTFSAGDSQECKTLKSTQASAPILVAFHKGFIVLAAFFQAAAGWHCIERDFISDLLIPFLRMKHASGILYFSSVCCLF